MDSTLISGKVFDTHFDNQNNQMDNCQESTTCHLSTQSKCASKFGNFVIEAVSCIKHIEFYSRRCKTHMDNDVICQELLGIFDYSFFFVSCLGPFTNYVTRSR